MIMLRRNDKIIIIVGILIILAAGIGVALYTPPNTITPPPAQQAQTAYSVTWTEKTAPLPSVTAFASKGTQYYITIKADQTNIATMSFRLTWVDDHALLKRFGLDTLTLDLRTPTNTAASFSEKSQKRTKAGDFTVNVSGIDQPPSVNSVMGNSSSDATSRLRAALRKNDQWAGKPFNVSVTVTIGERFFKFRDKGNSFTLAVNYSYYDFSLGTTSKTGDDNLGDLPPVDNTTSWTPPYMSMILNTGCGRYV